MLKMLTNFPPKAMIKVNLLENAHAHMIGLCVRSWIPQYKKATTRNDGNASLNINLTYMFHSFDKPFL